MPARIVKDYNQRGQEAVRNKHKGKPKSNATALLTPTQLEELKASLKHPPSDQGIWTGPKVAAWIAEKTGTEKVYAQRGWDYLKKLHYSLSSAKTEAPQGR
jgi:transposase